MRGVPPLLLMVIGAIALTGGLVMLLAWRFPGVLDSSDNVVQLVQLGLIAAVLLLWLNSQRLGSVFRALLGWAGIFLVLVFGYSYWDDVAAVFARLRGELVPAQGVAVEPGVVALRAGSGGHFRALADVNANRIQLLVDTGASEIALTSADARRVGIDPDGLTYNVPISTANGTVNGARVRLDSVQIGDIRVTNIGAHVLPGDRLSQSLLGMSFLRRLSSFEIRGDRMILRQ